MNNGIFEYIRRRHHGKVQKVGVIVAVKQDGVIRVSWSKCNYKSGDKFNQELGISLASNRALGIETSPDIPVCIQSQVRQIGARAIRYFKDSKQLVIV